MSIFEKEIDIARNIRIIDWLKGELLTDSARFFRTMVNGVSDDALDVLADCLSNIILICYLLARRLGISYNMLEIRMKNRIRIGISEQHEVEKNYGDLTALSKHFSHSREKIQAE